MENSCENQLVEIICSIPVENWKKKEDFCEDDYYITKLRGRSIKIKLGCFDRDICYLNGDCILSTKLWEYIDNIRRHINHMKEETQNKEKQKRLCKLYSKLK